MRHFPHFFRSLIPLLALLSTISHAQNVTPLSDRVDAIVAHPLVLPIKVEDPKQLRSGLRVRIDDGRPVESSAHFVYASFTNISTNWTRGTPNWTSITPSEYLKSKPNSPGTWIALIDLPIDAVGQGLWIDETRYEPNWLPSPLRVILESSARSNDGFWNAALTQQQQSSPYIRDALTSLRADPFNRWRARLMSNGFNPNSNERTGPSTTDRDFTAIHTELLQSDSVSVLDQIADHFTARWQIILGRIWLIDPSVAHRLKHQLTRTATADNLLIPMWTNDTTQLSALAHDLLSPFVNDELRVERVTGWLAIQPAAMSWIIDDAGHPSRHPLMTSPTVGVLSINHDETAQLLRVQSRGIEPLVDQLPHAQMTTRTIAVSTPIDTKAGQVTQPRTIRTQIGHDRIELQSLGSIPLGSPPGIIVGPMLNDWTLNALSSRNSGLKLLPPNDKQIAGLIMRDAPIISSNTNEGWRLYLECAIDPKSDIDTQIRVWTGPMDDSRASWTISRELGMVEFRSDHDVPEETRIISTTDKDRWIVQIDLPPQVLTIDGFLLIGLERIDQNTRSAWPRRMMPWQSEPGRFVIDTTNWTGTNPNP